MTLKWLIQIIRTRRKLDFQNFELLEIEEPYLIFEVKVYNF